MADFDDSLLDELIIESKEHLETIEPDLMELEENPKTVDPEAINRIFRAVHSIKGGFGFFSMKHIVELAHAMENVMGLIRDGELTVQSKIVDVLLSGADKLRVLIDDVQASEAIPINEEVKQLSGILNEGLPVESADGPPEFVEAMGVLNTPGPDRLADGPSNRLGELLRLLRDMATEPGRAVAEDILADYTAIVNAMGLDGYLREGVAEKLQKLLPFLPQQSADEPAATDEAAAVDEAPATEKPPTPTPSAREPTAQTLRVRVDLLDDLMNLAGELVLSRNRIKRALMDKLSSALAAGPRLIRLDQQLAASRNRLAGLARTAGDAHARALAVAVGQEFDRIDTSLRQLVDGRLSDFPALGSAEQDLNGVTSEIQAAVMGTRMQMVGTVFSKFPRVIRDMSRKLGKEIELSIQGENVELDKSIIEALGDPLTHLVRNSADHGVEAPEVREAAGKPARGRIELIARHEGGQVCIEITDDGAGINPEKIKKKAIERNLLSAKDAMEMTDREALRLIFAPGFSTAEQVSDLSGRGVGMDVVRSNIDKIGGSVEIESTPGRGSRIILSLPLTLAIMPALVIRNEGQDFAVPQGDIAELVRIRAQDAARQIESIHGRPVMRLRECVLPLVSLNDVLGIDGTYFDSAGIRQPDRRRQILDRRASEFAPTGSDVREESPENGDDENPRKIRGDRRSTRRSGFNIIVLRVGVNRYGLIVESLKDSEEIVVKPLPGHLKECKAYGGVTIMGDGQIALILDASGIAETAQIHFGGDLEKAEILHSDSYVRETMAEPQTVLVFRNDTSERFSINLAMIKRIEKIERSSIEHVSDNEYLKYENSSLRILRLHNYLPVKTPEQDRDQLFVIVPKLVPHPMGIVATAIEDILETRAPLDQTTIAGTGILGTIVENGSLIINLDLYGLFEAVEPDLHRAGGALRLRGKRVLLAEDTAFFRTVESEYLQNIGCDVEVAVDGEEAWAKLSSGRFDILVTDIQMPIVDGLELARRVRASQQHREMPIVALTSMTNEVDRQRILAAGFDAYEAKLDKDSLRKTLETLAARLSE